MLAAISLILFMLAAFDVRFDAVNIVDLGLGFLAAAFLFGNWPMGIWVRKN